MGKLLFVLLLVSFGCEKTSGFKVTVGLYEVTVGSLKVTVRFCKETLRSRMVTVQITYHSLSGITVFGIRLVILVTPVWVL